MIDLHSFYTRCKTDVSPDMFALRVRNRERGGGDIALTSGCNVAAGGWINMARKLTRKHFLINRNAVLPFRLCVTRLQGTVQSRSAGRTEKGHGGRSSACQRLQLQQQPPGGCYSPAGWGGTAAPARSGKHRGISRCSSNLKYETIMKNWEKYI